MDTRWRLLNKKEDGRNDRKRDINKIFVSHKKASLYSGQNPDKNEGQQACSAWWIALSNNSRNIKAVIWLYVFLKQRQ